MNKLHHQNLLGLCFASVHQAHPAHRVAGFQLLRRARCRRQLGHHLLQTVLRCLVDLDEVRIQLLGQQQLIVNQGTVFLQVRFPHPAVLIVNQGTVFLQVRFPHPAVLAQGLLRLFGQLQVGDLIISVHRVSQAVLHV